VFSHEEADAITSLAPRNSLLKATGFEANRQLAASGELSRYRIVHFATHGLINILSRDVERKPASGGGPVRGADRDVQAETMGRAVLLGRIRDARGVQIASRRGIGFLTYLNGETGWMNANEIESAGEKCPFIS
jgi:hypothetical protein